MLQFIGMRDVYQMRVLLNVWKSSPSVLISAQEPHGACKEFVTALIPRATQIWIPDAIPVTAFGA